MKWNKINESSNDNSLICMEDVRAIVQEGMWDIIDKGLSTSVKLSKKQENELISHLIDDNFNGLKFANNDEFRDWMEYNWETISYDDVYEQICGGNYVEDSVLYDEIIRWLDKNIPLPLDDDDIEQMKYDFEHDV